MTQNEDLDRDIDQFFRQTKNMLPESKKEALRLLMDKYIFLNRAPTLFDRRDFEEIKEKATNKLIEKAWPKKIEGDSGVISERNASLICLVEATIDHLEGEGCLKKHPKFKYKGE